jgi:ribosome-associated heat shock protein Hsp15
MSKSIRIDKFLWSVRLYKTRSKATEACKAGKVRVNEQVVRAAKAVSVGDVFSLRKGPVTYSYKILELLNSRVGAKLVDQYIKNNTLKEELEKLEILKLSYTRWRERGAGRPTKKDRREIDQFDTVDADDSSDLNKWNNWEDWDEEELK